MKTLKPDFNRLKSNFSLLDINIGSVLKDKDTAACYIISGISFTEYALVRAYTLETMDMQAAIRNSGLLELHKNLYASSDCIPPEAYVDCSKLVVRSFGVISTWLKKYPEQYLGQLHPKDQDVLFQTISSANTIPRKLKKEFSFI